MPYRRRSHKQKILVPVLIRVAIGVCIIAGVVASGFLLRSWTRKPAAVASRQLPPQPGKVQLHEPEDASSEIAGRYYGLCKKNSVRTIEDLRRTVEEDPVLARHLAGFNWERARLGKLEQATWTYVSFRTGSEIRRTSRPVLLPAGDRYITDGSRKVRAYCCNDYDFAPPPLPVPVTTIEPDPMIRALAAPAFERMDGNLPGLAKAIELENVPHVSWSAEPGSGLPPIGPTGPPRASHPPWPPFQNHSSSHVVTPEPSSSLLFGAGVAVFLLVLLLNRRAGPGK